LPKVIEQYGEPGARPFTRAEAREAFAPDPEWEKLESAMTGGSHPQPEED
jgi:hypothetical protein